jgi:hypothetical protein
MFKRIAIVAVAALPSLPASADYIDELQALRLRVSRFRKNCFGLAPGSSVKAQLASLPP